MKKRIILTALASVFGSVLLIGTRTLGTVAYADDDGNEHTVALLDNCDPTDPAWAPTGGCTLKPEDGNVKFAEFAAFLFTPLSPPGTLIGHPSWRIQPSYITTDEREIHVRNGGGRTHTFTEVTNYGGGFVPPLKWYVGSRAGVPCFSANSSSRSEGNTQESESGPA